MEPTHPTAGWESVGDKWFRKIQLYTAVFEQDLELDNYVVAGAPYGGALGMFVERDFPTQSLMRHLPS
jgi:vacuolar protein sorting-associated protein 16